MRRFDLCSQDCPSSPKVPLRSSRAASRRNNTSPSPALSFKLTSVLSPNFAAGEAGAGSCDESATSHQPVPWLVAWCPRGLAMSVPTPATPCQQPCPTFVPSYQWQTLCQCQSVPPGLEVRTRAPEKKKYKAGKTEDDWWACGKDGGHVVNASEVPHDLSPFFCPHTFPYLFVSFCIHLFLSSMYRLMDAINGEGSCQPGSSKCG